MLNSEKKEAMFYEKTQNSTIKCGLCRQSCIILEGKRGLCGVRISESGKLYTLVYGKAAATGVDPIEKKPLFHFHPGSSTYSISTVGCNFRCKNCQNFEISQLPKEYGHCAGLKGCRRYRPPQQKDCLCRNEATLYTPIAE